MAKIYPSLPPLSSSSSFYSNETETYTILMKSLVMNSNGYTVYDSKENVVFRIDNYDTKCSNEVYLMDLRGNVLCTILRKKLLSFGLWNCYHNNDSCRRWFKVGKAFNCFKNDWVYDVLVGTKEAQDVSSLCHTMEGSVHGLEFKVTDSQGRVAAEVQQKRSSSGVVFGQDVLHVTVEPQVDHIFVLALVAIQGLIRRKM